MSSYHYTPTADCLQNIIHSVWQIDQATNFATEYIVPKGRVEIIFNFSDSFAISANLCGKQYCLPRCFINGFNKKPITVHLPKQQVFFGIVLHPLASKKILNIPAGEFSDITVDLTLINTSFCSLWHQLAAEANFNSRIAILHSWTMQHAIDWAPQEQLLNHFLYNQYGHEFSTSKLARYVCYSNRHLSRKIIAATGMNTEEILLYKKYLHSIHLLHNSDLSLTKIAYQSQFSDQSHFIRSFKMYTGMTPRNYRCNKSHVEGHLYNNVR